MEPHELALQEVGESPWLQQRELAARLHEQTGLAESTLIRLFRRMEAEGDLRSGLDGRRKTYALPEPAAAPTPGALWASELEPLGERAPEPDEPPEPPRPAQPAEPPEHSEPAPALVTKPGWPLAAVVACVLAFAVLAAVVLSPEKRDPFTGGERDESSKPVKASSSRPPASTPEKEPPARTADAPPPKPAADAGLTAAKKVRIAVLSGVAEPGAAAKEGKRLKATGFRIGVVSNAPGPAERFTVFYARGAKVPAEALAKEAGIRSVKAVDPATAGAAKGSQLYVVVGAQR